MQHAPVSGVLWSNKAYYRSIVSQRYLVSYLMEWISSVSKQFTVSTQREKPNDMQQRYQTLHAQYVQLEARFLEMKQTVETQRQQLAKAENKYAELERAFVELSRKKDVELTAAMQSYANDRAREYIHNLTPAASPAMQWKAIHAPPKSNFVPTYATKPLPQRPHPVGHHIDYRTGKPYAAQAYAAQPRTLHVAQSYPTQPPHATQPQAAHSYAAAAAQPSLSSAERDPILKDPVLRRLMSQWDQTCGLIGNPMYDVTDEELAEEMGRAYVDCSQTAKSRGVSDSGFSNTNQPPVSGHPQSSGHQPPAPSAPLQQSGNLHALDSYLPSDEDEYDLPWQDM